MAERCFRVLLDLRDLHMESFKYVWINVSPREVKTIADFKISLLNKIKLSSEIIKLFVRDGLLLDEETIMVLREDDTVKVQFGGQFIPVNDDAAGPSKEHKKSSRKRGLDESNHENVVSSHKKHKKSYRYSVSNQDDVCETVLDSTTKKKHKSNNLVLDNDVREINCTVEADGQRSVTVLSKKKKKKSSVTNDNLKSFDPLLLETASCSTKKKNLTFEVSSNDNLCDFTKSRSKDLVPSDKSLSPKEKLKSNQEELQIIDKEIGTEANSGLKNNCPKKKRKRHRKRKKVAECVIVGETAFNANLNSEFKSFTDIDDTCTKRKHTIFKSPSHSLDDPLCERSIEITISDDDDDNIQNKSENICLEELSKIDDQSQASYPKMSTPAQSNGYADPNWRVTLMQNENSNFSDYKTSSPKKRFSEIKLDEVGSSPVKCPESDECLTKKKYENFPSLKLLPEIGVHIAYKILELDENYSPTVSEFREGIVKKIDSSTEEMEIEFSKHEIKPGRTGKFENLKEDEIPLPEIKSGETVTWSSLIEPKLLS